MLGSGVVVEVVGSGVVDEVVGSGAVDEVVGVGEVDEVVGATQLEISVLPAGDLKSAGHFWHIEIDEAPTVLKNEFL